MAGRKRKKEAGDALRALADTGRAQGEALEGAKKQLSTIAKVAGVTLVVIWLLALGFWSGLQSIIPLIVAGVLTGALAVAAFLVRRNFGRSQELGGLIADGADLSDAERAARIDKLAERVDKGETAAIMAVAQLQMQDEPKAALATLEKADLDKGPKMVAHQVRGMRAMLHLNLGEVKAARELVDAIDLGKLPDPKSRANLAGIISEAWARSGNPIEASELLDKYDPDQKDMSDVRVQLLRARIFAAAHRNDMTTVRKAMKQLEELSPQLLAVFVGQKRVHPLLQKEARKRLEKTGLIPRVKLQGARR